MAQNKKKVPAKSAASKSTGSKSTTTKSPAKASVRGAATVKPAKKTSETKAATSKKSVVRAATKSTPSQAKSTKSVTKPVVKLKSPAKAVSAKPTAKPAAAKPGAAKPVAAKPVAKQQAPKVAEKVAVKPAAAPAAPAAALAPAKAAIKPAAPTKPTASAAPPVTTAKAAPPVADAAAKAAKPAGAKPVPPVKPVAPVAGPARTVPSAVAKPAVRTFPTTSTGPSGAAATPRELAQKAAELRQQQMANAVSTAAATTDASKKPVIQRHGFKINESIVYPAHGVGRIVGIEEQEIAGMSLELFVIQFEKDKMTLRVPTGKLQSVGMRKLAEDDLVTRAMDTLKGRARVKRTMWSRRAQEYEAKINSGDLIQIAEVVRDLYRSESQPEQSYSERQLYEAALDRMSREIAAVSRIDERGAVQRITEVLSKSAKGRRAADDAEAAGASGDAKAA